MDGFTVHWTLIWAHKIGILFLDISRDLISLVNFSKLNEADRKKFGDQLRVRVGSSFHNLAALSDSLFPENIDETLV